jgi:hypothetical protein
LPLATARGDHALRLDDELLVGRLEALLTFAERVVHFSSA